MKLQINSETSASTMLPSPIFPSTVMSDESKYSCSYCDLKFSNNIDLFGHLSFEYVNLNKRKNIKCAYCALSFSSFRGMKQHIGKIHEKKKNIPCSICGKLFKDKYAIKFHTEHVHETSQRVQCENCSFLCYTKYVYEAHKLRCPNSKPNQCLNTL